MTAREAGGAALSIVFTLGMVACIAVAYGVSAPVQVLGAGLDRVTSGTIGRRKRC